MKVQSADGSAWLKVEATGKLSRWEGLIGVNVESAGRLRRAEN